MTLPSDKSSDRSSHNSTGDLPTSSATAASGGSAREHRPTGIIAKLRGLQLTEKIWFNGLWFQSTWFICVLGQDRLLPVALVMIALHFALVPAPQTELRQLAPIVTLGVVVDALLSAAGVFDFGATLIPLWLCVLWIAFATTLNRALRILGQRPWLSALVGGVGVPFNYAAGATLGAVTLPQDPWVTMSVLVAVWAALLPGLYAIARINQEGCRQP